MPDAVHVKRESSIREGEMDAGRSTQKPLQLGVQEYRTVIETTDTGFVIIDADGTVLEANTRYARLSGHETVAEILGRNVLEWTAPGDRDKSMIAVRRCLAEGTLRSLELDHIDASGRVTPVELNGTVIHVENGVQVVALCRDISARRQTQDSLERRASADALITRVMSRLASCTSEQIDKAVIDSLHDLADFFGLQHAYLILAVADRATWSFTHEWCSPGVEGMVPRYRDIPLGTLPWSEEKLLVTGEVLMITSVDDYPPEAEPERRMPEWQRGRASLCITPIRYATGAPAGALGVDSYWRRAVWTDEHVILCRIIGNAIAALIERKQAEEALQSSERRFRAVFEQAPFGIALVDSSSGRILQVNRKYGEIVGRTPEEMLRLDLRAITHREDLDLDREDMERMREGDARLFSVEKRYDRQDGATVWVHLIVVPMSGSGEHPRCHMTIAEDITERKRSESERERLRDQAEAANAAKDQFLAVLSHELRNPLAAIQAGADLLRRSGIADMPVAGRALGIIERNAKLQARLVNDLLDLSRIVRGKLTLRPSPIPIYEAVLSAIHACNAEASRAGVALNLHATSGLWTNADIDRLQQVLINLIANAIKFTGAGGNVTVGVDGIEGGARIVIEDTGIGIEASRLPNLFQMFQQGQVGSQRAPGLGIGLALVKSLTEMQGGRVWAESAGPGLGSRFTVEMPTCEPALGSHPEPVARSKHGPVRVLFVEDNPDTRTMLAETLSTLGYQVLAAESGEAALEILSRESVDAIVADIGLPGMDGYEFLRRAHRMSSVTVAPAFAVTGYGQQHDVRRALAAGYVAHFVKPIELAVLDQQIRLRLANKDDAA